jgi:tRNA(Ile)-lysidine synthase
MDLLRKVCTYIVQHRMVKREDKVVVAVSGGPDSMALLYALNALKDELAISLHVAHLNHMFRGGEAAKDARLVARTAELYGLPATVEAIDVPAYRKQARLSAQAAARAVRYRFLKEVAGRTGASRVALAHHADDQAETVLLHFIRGAGPPGLKGMEPVRGIYIRPFLLLRRAQILEYCRAKQLPFRVDASNLKPVYTRNRLRLSLLPLLEKEYNPNLVTALLRLADICREEDDFLDQAARAAYREVLLEGASGRLVLSATVLARQHVAVKRRIVRQAFFELTGGQDLTFQHVEAALAVFGAKGAGTETILPGGIRARLSYDRAELLAGVRENAPKFFYRLEWPGVTDIPEIGLRICAEILPAGAAPVPEDLPATEAIFDLDRLPAGLYVRQRLPGDIFRPYGMHGTMKLKDFLIKQKLPREERDWLPIVATPEEILWVGGVRTAGKWKVTDETKIILYLKIKRASKGN